MKTGTFGPFVAGQKDGQKRFPYKYFIRLKYSSPGMLPGDEYFKRIMGKPLYLYG
jgi:hypothetical protein